MLSSGSSVKGSIRAQSGSGINSMSEASMLFHPAIEEPSKKCPLSNLSIVKALTGTETCCSLPRVSVKRRSTNLTSLSLIIFMTSLRSEERRVGKECRYQMALHYEKKRRWNNKSE